MLKLVLNYFNQSTTSFVIQLPVQITFCILLAVYN